jgi:hypothetical protein
MYKEDLNMYKEDLNMYWFFMMPTAYLLRLIFPNNLLHVDSVVALFIVSFTAKEDMVSNF